METLQQLSSAHAFIDYRTRVTSWYSVVTAVSPASEGLADPSMLRFQCRTDLCLARFTNIGRYHDNYLGVEFTSMWVRTCHMATHDSRQHP